jgi:outer membrane protein assembly factor BamB
LINRSRVWGVALVLLLLGFLLSACGSVPVAQNWPGLTVADGVVYAISGSPSQVYMLDAETGVQKGTFTYQGAYRGVLYWSPVTVVDGTAYAGLASIEDKLSALIAFDAKTGQEQWRVQAQAGGEQAGDLILNTPAYADGIVYFGTSAGWVYAVDVTTRAIKPGWPFQTGEAIWGSLRVIDGRVYVPSMDHHLYCLDAQTGQVVWTFEAGGAMAAQPSPDDGTLYQGAFDGRAYAVGADSGEKVSGFDFQAGNWIWSEVLVTDGRLYVTSLDGKLHALDAATGQELPGYPYSTEASDYIRAAPVMVGDLIIAATGNGRVIAVNAESGQVSSQWPGAGITPAAGILTNPVVVEDRVYVILNTGVVQVLNLVDGALAQGWTFSPPTAK